MSNLEFRMSEGKQETQSQKPGPALWFPGVAKELRTEVTEFPKRLTIELSSLCNLSCVMCPRQYVSGDLGFMDEMLFRKIVQEIRCEEVEWVVPYFRGESLLHPRFMELLSLLRKNSSAKIHLATNALLLSEEMIHHLLFETRIDFISFSLDAVTEETYRKIRLGGMLEKARENVLRFLHLRDASASETVVQVSLTESVLNLEEISSFISYWRGRADRVRIYPLPLGGRGLRRARIPRLPQGPLRKITLHETVQGDRHLSRRQGGPLQPRLG